VIITDNTQIPISFASWRPLVRRWSSRRADAAACEAQLGGYCRRLTKGGNQLCPAPSPITTVQGRMVHEVTKPLRT
jgi:hypothetical protein